MTTTRSHSEASSCLFFFFLLFLLNTCCEFLDRNSVSSCSREKVGGEYPQPGGVGGYIHLSEVSDGGFHYSWPRVREPRCPTAWPQPGYGKVREVENPTTTSSACSLLNCCGCCGLGDTHSAYMQWKCALSCQIGPSEALG